MRTFSIQLFAVFFSLLVMASCSDNSISPEQKYYDPLSSFTIPLYTALPRETKIEFIRGSNDQIVQINLLTRVTYQEEPFESGLSMTLMYNDSNELTSFQTEVFDSFGGTNQSETKLQWSNGSISVATTINHNSESQIIFEYDEETRLEKMIDENRTIILEYNQDGNIVGFGTDEVANPILEAYAQYDNRKNPFSKLELPKPILLLVLRNVFTDEQLAAATFLSQNNVFFEENEYSIKGLPTQIGSFMSLEY